MYQYFGTPNQDWYLYDLGKGVYKLQNVNSQKFLSVTGNSTANRAVANQYSDNGQTGARWKLELVSESSAFTNYVQDGIPITLGQTFYAMDDFQSYSSTANLNQVWDCVNKAGARGVSLHNWNGAKDMSISYEGLTEVQRSMNGAGDSCLYTSLIRLKIQHKLSSASYLQSI